MEPSKKFTEDFFEATASHRARKPDKEEITREPRTRSYPSGARVALPDVKPEGGMAIWEAMALRRSIRKYKPDSITMEQLSRLLWAAQGVTEKRGEITLRTAPSAGALAPCETYVIVKNVEGLEPGSYHLNVDDWALELVKAGEVSAELVEACLGQKFVGQTPVVIASTVIAGRFLWRYRKRGIRYAFTDLGHIGQNIALAAAAMGMGCCAVGAFYDDEVAKIIGHRNDEHSVYLNPVGFPAE